MNNREKVARLEKHSKRRRGFLAIEQGEDGALYHEGKPLSCEEAETLAREFQVFIVREDG